MERLPSPPASPPLSHTAERISRPTPAEPRADFATLLGRFTAEAASGQAMITRALSSRSQMTPQELLALQAGIYRYSETLELAAKLVDKVSSAVRTTLQSQ